VSIQDSGISNNTLAQIFATVRVGEIPLERERDPGDDPERLG
jgi:hypothetical protein